MKSKRVLGVASLLLLLAACTTQSRVVLLPDETGKTGKLAVTSEHGTRTLAEPYQGTSTGRFWTDDEKLDPAQVKKRYGDVIGALPKAPRQFVLYFASGGDVLTDASLQDLATIHSALTEYSAPELVVIGHTDRVGALVANDALSLLRAEVIRELLVTEGFERETISVVGRGEREPAVPTADEVAEPRNRRVEVKLR